MRKDEFKAMKAAEYKELCNTRAKRIEAEIKALEAVKIVCEQFNGKVINKRYHDAVKAATGFYSTRTAYRYELTQYSQRYDANQYAGVEFYNEAEYWNTGARMNAEKARQAIDEKLKDRRQDLAETINAHTLFNSYVDKARELGKQVQQLKEETPYHLREFVRSSSLLDYYSVKQVFQN